MSTPLHLVLVFVGLLVLYGLAKLFVFSIDRITNGSRVTLLAMALLSAGLIVAIAERSSLP